jgi:Tfp pilus assembly protein PilF
LGLSLGAQARHPEAEAAYRRAIALKDDQPEAHCGLGIALGGQGRPKEAEAAFRRAIDLKQNYPEAHYSLGLAVSEQGRYQEAEAAYRRAIALKPDYAEAHCNLGHALRSQGQFAAAVASLKRGHELGSKNPHWPNPSARWLQEAERLLALDRRLPAVLKGQVQPTDAREGIDLAQLCLQYKRLYAASARLYADAFAAEPRLADDPRAAHRYDAARCAALAAAGKGEDAAKLEDEGRTRLRGQALAWLRADLRTWAALVEKGTPQDRAFAVKALRHWQANPALAGVRDAATLAGLPQAERADWQRLWADVRALLDKASGKGTQGK